MAKITCVEDTVTLETELRALSEKLAAGQVRFAAVSAELRHRRRTKDEQPAQPTEEELVATRRKVESDLGKNLVLKITAMEAEQAKLVVEAEAAKTAQYEAEKRLNLLAKMVAASGTKEVVEAAQPTLQLLALADQAKIRREPVTRNEAYTIAVDHLNKEIARRRTSDDIPADEFNEIPLLLTWSPPSWVIDAIIQTSR